MKYNDQRTCLLQYSSGTHNSVLKHGIFKNVKDKSLSYLCQIRLTFCKPRK